ncbi:hypothetical protein [Cupriavidus basilensis]
MLNLNNAEKVDDERKEGRRTRTLERQVPSLLMHDRNPSTTPASGRRPAMQRRFNQDAKPTK